MQRIVFLLLLVYLIAGRVMAQESDQGLDFDYFYRENQRTTTSSDNLGREDYMLSRGGTLSFEYLLRGLVEYRSRDLNITDGGVGYLAVNQDSKASLVAPMEYFFLRGDEKSQVQRSYLEASAWGFPNGIYKFNDQTTLRQSSQAAGFRIPSWELEAGYFQGTLAETKTVTQSLRRNNLEYDLSAFFRGVHLQKRPVDFQGPFMGFMWRQVGASEITGVNLETGAELQQKDASYSLGYGFDNGSRIFARQSAKRHLKEFSLTTGNQILDQSDDDGYAYGMRIEANEAGISFEKRHSQAVATYQSDVYYSLQKNESDSLIVGFGYDANMTFNLEMAKEKYSLEKSNDPQTPRATESRVFEDITLGLGFSLSFF